MMNAAFRHEVEKVAREQATGVYRDLGTRYGVSETPRHIHGGYDAETIPYSSVRPFYEFIHWTLPGTSAATATNYGVFWIAPADCSVAAFQEVHQTAGSDASAVTLQLEKLTGTQAPGAGTEVLNATLSLKATANTVQDGVILPGSASLLKGDRLCLKDAGTLTAVANITILATIKYQ